jgi:hypothetical protein
MVSWYRRWPDSDVAVFYAIGRPGMTADDMADGVAADLARAGASLGTVHRWDRWRYFPHVTAREMAQGFYRDFEAMQGRRGTWYAGELLSFPTVEHVVAYSRRLVDTHF